MYINYKREQIEKEKDLKNVLKKINNMLIKNEKVLL